MAILFEFKTGETLWKFLYMIASYTAIPFAGLIAWGILRIKNKPVALGILFGFLTPLVVFFFVTGGCGMFYFYD